MKNYNFDTLPSLFKDKKWLKRTIEVENAFLNIRHSLCKKFQKLENEFCTIKSLKPSNFKKKIWIRNKINNEYGGGTSMILKGRLFEKVGVNISTVSGVFPKDFKNKIKGASKDPRFFATGISVVAHMYSPFIPAAHYNSRFIVTKDAWFGGGCDLTPTFYQLAIEKKFHKMLKDFCDAHNKNYYKKFSKWCKEYFFLKHRNEERGIGGIFFDYLDNDWEKNFNFTCQTGEFFNKSFCSFINQYRNKEWTNIHRKKLFDKRSKYAEFNLLYDKGTLFGLKTNGNIEAILMSMPPLASWS